MSNQLKINKVKRTSLSGQAVQEIERQIREGNWQPGDRIPPEPELAALFGISRNTIREALQSLIHAGVLAARPGDGTYVQRKSRMESALHCELAGQSLSTVLEARLTLELGIVKLAALNRTENDLNLIRQALDLRNTCDNTELDAKFHMQIAYAAHNPLLTDFYNEICRYMVSNLPEKPLEGSAYQTETALHEELFHAIARQNADDAQCTAQTIIGIYAGRFEK